MNNYKNYFILKENNNITYSLNNGNYYVKEYKITTQNNIFTVANNNKEYTFTTKLLGNIIYIIVQQV